MHRILGSIILFAQLINDLHVDWSDSSLKCSLKNVIRVNCESLLHDTDYVFVDCENGSVKNVLTIELRLEMEKRLHDVCAFIVKKFRVFFDWSQKITHCLDSLAFDWYFLRCVTSNHWDNFHQSRHEGTIVRCKVINSSDTWHWFENCLKHNEVGLK